MSPPTSAPAALACIGCGSAIAGTYYLAGGTRPVCSGCKAQVEGAPLGPAGPALARAAGLGLLAAVVAAAAWALIVIVTNLMLGIVAVAVGYLVGLAVRRGAGRHSGGAFQALAMALTVLAIVWSTLPMVFHELSKDSAGEEAPAPNAPVLKLRVADDGRITADGQPLPAEQVALRVAALKGQHGVVWYWREHPERPSDALPPAQDASCELVLDAVRNHHVPLKRVQDDQGTPAPEPTRSGGSPAWGLGYLVLVIPFLVYGSMVSGDPMTLLFLGIAVYEAWKLNRRRTLLFTGPFEREAALDFSAP